MAVSVAMAAISTLGEAHDHGWIIKVYCREGYIDNRTSQSKCHWSYTPDMMTLLLTRGRNFPLLRLDQMVKCPNCGRRDLQIAISIPGDADRRPKRAMGWP
jgi:hypothetical protein